MARCGHPYVEQILTRAGWKCQKCGKIVTKKLVLKQRLIQVLIDPEMPDDYIPEEEEYISEVEYEL